MMTIKGIVYIGAYPC